VNDFGMGECWLARHDTGTDQLVLIKLLLLQDVAEDERSRLALLRIHHPALPRLVDAGVAGQDWFYLAFEYFDGLPITDFCDQVFMDTLARLEFFARICSHVQTIHQLGLIHGNLTPLSIRVSTVRDIPTPTIYGFGMTTLVPGIDPRPDIRSDLNSLGAILFELLTGVAPGGQQATKSRKKVQPKPSTCLLNMDEKALDEVARKRRTNPLLLASRMRGRIDLIVQKASSTNPDLRYRSLNELGEDIRGFLVVAPSGIHAPFSFEARRWIRRHRSVVALCTLAVAILVGLAASTAFLTSRSQTVSIQLRETEIARRQELHLSVINAPPHWSGKVSVNGSEILPIDADRLALRVTPQNGFVDGANNVLSVMLSDPAGKALRTDHAGPLTVKVIPSRMELEPDSDTIPPAGASGTLRVKTPSGYQWEAHNIPDWVRFSSTLAGTGSRTVEYEVDPNSTGKDRSARIAIGTEVLEITQLATPPLASSAPNDQRVKVTLSAQRIKLGRELEIHIDDAPPNWYGELTINTMWHFKLDSKVFRVPATPQNGFKPGQTAKLFMLLFDSRHQQIPLSNGGTYSVFVIPSAVTLDSDHALAGLDGMSSSIMVNADDGYTWSVSGVPAWATVDRTSGSGPGKISYRILKNDTNEERSALLQIGDATFSISQPHPADLQLPYRDRFEYSVPPPPLTELFDEGSRTIRDSPLHWVWERQRGQDPKLAIAAETPTAGKSLVIGNLKGDSRAWAVQLFLRKIALESETAYSLTVWMKAEHPGSVSVGLGQSTSPFAACGLDRSVAVTEKWTRYDLRFQMSGQHCEAANNRLYFGAGQIRGKLWIADFSLSAAR
jgi:hypothetical protein